MPSLSSTPPPKKSPVGVEERVAPAAAPTMTKEDSSTITVRHFYPEDEDVPEILENLADAFAEEALATHFANQPSNVLPLALAQFHIYCRCTPRGAHMYTLNNRKGAMIAFHLPNEKISFFSQIINGLPNMLWRFIRWSNWMTLAQGEDFLDLSKAEYMQDNGIDTMLHIQALGVHRQYQKKGYGSELIQEITAHANRTGQHCYLEASSEDNKAFYKKHGFILYREYQVGSDGPILYLMGRRPSAPPTTEVAQ